VNVPLTLTATLMLTVAGCAALKPKTVTVVKTDTVIVSVTKEAPLPTGDSTTICLSTGMPAKVVIAANGDTLIGDARASLKSVRPILNFAGNYAADADWFYSDTLRFEKRLYRKAGALQKRACDELKTIGAHEGVPIFAEIEAKEPISNILIAARPGWFQLYTTPVANTKKR